MKIHQSFTTEFELNNIKAIANIVIRYESDHSDYNTFISVKAYYANLDV